MEKMPASFESALKRLEEIVQRLEQGSLGLEESLQAYEEGMYLYRFCGNILKAAEERIQMLLEVPEGGTTVVPFIPQRESQERKSGDSGIS